MNSSSFSIHASVLSKFTLDNLKEKLSPFIYKASSEVSEFEVLSQLADSKFIYRHLEFDKTTFNGLFFEDSFLKTVRFKRGISAGLIGAYASFSEGTLLMDNSYLINQNNVLTSKVYTLQSDVQLPYLVSNNEVLHLLSPIELLETKKILAHMKGDILVDGVQLGYFLFHASLKASVSTITVIEEDTSLIHFFEQQVLPHLGELASKIEIIQGNFDEHVQNSNALHYFDAVALLNHKTAEVGLQRLLMTQKTACEIGSKTPIYFLYQEELHGIIQQMCFWISYLRLNEKSKEDSLALGKYPNSAVFFLYNQLCEVIYAKKNPPQSTRSVFQLISEVSNIKSIL